MHLYLKPGRILSSQVTIKIKFISQIKTLLALDYFDSKSIVKAGNFVREYTNRAILANLDIVVIWTPLTLERVYSIVFVTFGACDILN